MIERRYQYWSRNGIVWTKWFEYTTKKTLKELLKQKPIFKYLKEEYREV